MKIIPLMLASLLVFSAASLRAEDSKDQKEARKQQEKAEKEAAKAREKAEKERQEREKALAKEMKERQKRAEEAAKADEKQKKKWREEEEERGPGTSKFIEARSQRDSRGPYYYNYNDPQSKDSRPYYRDTHVDFARRDRESSSVPLGGVSHDSSIHSSNGGTTYTERGTSGSSTTVTTTVIILGDE